MSESTLFNLVGIGMPPYSARGITQTLEPIQTSGQMRRTINGTLEDLGATQFRKYQSSVTCTDMDSPALSGIWPGMTVTVECIPELCYPDVTSEGAERTVVSGSSRSENGFVWYRPQLTMKVAGFRIGTDEYGASCNWSMDLIEV